LYLFIYASHFDTVWIENGFVCKRVNACACTMEFWNNDYR